VSFPLPDKKAERFVVSIALAMIETGDFI